MSDAPFTPPRPATPVGTAADLPSRSTPHGTVQQQFEAAVNPKPKRKPATRKAAPKKPAKKKRAVRAKPEATKNPNRPLEMKNQLQVVLSMTGSLRKPELVMFAKLVDELGSVARGGRKRIMAALAQVYPS